MYVCPPGNEIHTTTNNILEFVCGPGGKLYSFDIDPAHIEFAQNFCADLKGTLVGVEGDSVDSLRRHSAVLLDGEKVDLLCLDGRDFDEDHMVEEFKAIQPRLAESHFVLVDDIHNPNSVKWKKMVPLLKSLDYTYMEVNTPTGMFVAWKGYLGF